ncbi:MAG: hypothetical protein BGO95_06100 [Micrococcales bacterium 73-13]|nr:MAG: hypothetical protein BGO95_06100 [Micrococcales bacterium 73-13]
MTDIAGKRDPLGDRHRSLKSELIDELRMDIVQGRLEPGERLVERTLSETYGVSRVPLREAMLHLAAEGFLTITPRRGATVATFTIDSVSDLFDVREQLDSLAARLAAERIDAAGVKRLEQALLRAEQTALTDDEAERTVENARFHELIVDLAESPLLTSIMKPIGARVRWLFSFMSRAESSPLLAQEHRRLFELIAGGDGPQAAEYARAHVAATRQSTIDALAELMGADA